MGMREKLIELVRYMRRTVTPWHTSGDIADMLIANGMTIPVQCKDCKFYVWDEFDGCYVCVRIGKFVDTDFWCAYGERRTKT